MSNNSWDKLLDADKLIRRLPLEQTPAQIKVLLQIQFIRGFELFNTRPYHNYETWGDGYIVEAFDEDGKCIAKSKREDLEEALAEIKRDIGAI